MNEKEKAKDLFDSYYYCLLQSDVTQRTYWAKQCALIAVKQIIESNPIKTNSYDYGECNIMYWQEVRQEIENL